MVINVIRFSTPKINKRKIRLENSDANKVLVNISAFGINTDKFA